MQLIYRRRINNRIIMDKNVVITLSSSDEEGDILKPGESNTRVPTANNSPSRDTCIKMTVQKSEMLKMIQNNCHISLVKKGVTIKKLIPSLVGKSKNTESNPEVVDLVDGFDKSEGGSCEVNESDKKLDKNNQPDSEIIEIDVKTPSENLSVKSLSDDSEDEDRSENEAKKMREDSTVDKTTESTDVVVNTSQPLESISNKMFDEVQNSKSKSMTNESVEFFKEFVNYCGSFEDIPNDRTKLTKKLMKRYEEADPDYVRSQEFKNLIHQYRDKLKKFNLYLIAREVTGELSLNKKLSLTSHKPKSRASENGDSQENCALDKRKRKLIRRISKRLDKLGEKIRELEEEEVDLSDEEDSTYVKLQRYRNRFCQVYKKLCTYRNEIPDADREYCRKICFSGSKYPAINKCIENWLNKTNRFPDFTDIMKLLESQSSSLGLASNRDSIRVTATEIFQQVGVMLQRRRKYDLYDSFSGFLNDEEDPASKDPELERVLKENFEMRVKKEEKIIQYYAEMQEKEKLEPEEVPEDVANNSPMESESEDEKEIEFAEDTINQKLDVAIENDQLLDDTKENDDNENSEREENSSGDETEPREEKILGSKESKNNYRNCKSLKWRSGGNSESSNTEGDGRTRERSEEDGTDLEVEEAKENRLEDPNQKKRRQESEFGFVRKKKRPNSTWTESIDIDVEVENLTEVFDVNFCHIEQSLDRFHFGEDLGEKERDWGKKKVFRDLTNVNRLMGLHGKRRKSSGLSPLFFNGFPSLDRQFWKKPFKIGYKLVTSKEEKCSLGQEGKTTGKRVNGTGGGAGERNNRKNSGGGGEEGSNHFARQGSGSEEDNNENDENKKKSDVDENKLEEEKDEENEEEESEKQSEEHSSEEPAKKTKQISKNESNTNYETVEDSEPERSDSETKETEERADEGEGAIVIDEKTEIEEILVEEPESKNKTESEKCNNHQRATTPSPMKAPPRKTPTKSRRRNVATPSDEERVKRFLLHSPSSISITPPKKLSLSKPPSQAALKALATLRGLKDISATRVTREVTPTTEDEVIVIGGSRETPKQSRRSELPIISSVQSINSTTPKILTVQGNVSGFESSWQPENSENSSSLRIANVWGNLPSDFVDSMHRGHDSPGCSSRRSKRGSSHSVKKNSKKTVEYVVLE